MKQPDEQFERPEVASPKGLEDGRDKGSWKTNYCVGAWVQIVLECSYLLFLLAACGYLFINMAQIWTLQQPVGLLGDLVGPAIVNKKIILWFIVSLSGMCGGLTFDLKWLYHTVAKGYWNQDRIVWRTIVPFLSATLAVFTGAMISSGIIPFLKDTALDDPIACAGFGFFVGWFSDNVLAGLRGIAQRIFGNMDSQNKTTEDDSKSS